MTKFEEELFNKVPCKFELTTEAEYKKSTLINHFENWHSDEEFKAEIKKLTDQLITRNDELISSNYEIESLKSQLISREKQVIELKEADKAQGKEIIQLKSQLQQQALPVVPECVGEWIEILKTKGLKPLKNPETYGETGFTEEKLQNIVFWISENQEDYMRAWLDGYTVEKPQLFYIEFPKVSKRDSYPWVIEIENGIIIDFTNKKSTALKLTEQEIKSIDERYWQFAVPVEDGE